MRHTSELYGDIDFESFYQDATSKDSERTVFAETPVGLKESYDMRIPVKRTEAPSPV
jgi:hypothetical protein